MHICLISDRPVPLVSCYGGTERVVHWLASELVCMGLEVTVLSPSHLRTADYSVRMVKSRAAAIDAIPANADIVHFHGWIPDDIDSHFNWCMTLHGNEPNIETLPRRCIGISQSHARRHSCAQFVYNGIDPREFLYSDTKSNSFLFFSKFRRRVKGARRAIQLAKQYDFSLDMVGGFRPDFIKLGCFLDSFSKGIRVHGEKKGFRKASFFRDARALLFPIAWEEPFGLVLMESLVSGTPVIACPCGSVPELITDEVGRVFSNDGEFSSALESLDMISSKRCHEYVMDQFTASHMARAYLSIYKRMVDRDDSIWAA